MPAPAPVPVRRALVVGLGISGQAAAQVLAAAGAHVTMFDDRADHPEARRLREQGVEVVLGGDPSPLLDDVEVVVPSPGVPQRAPVLTAAAAAGLPVWSEPELAWRLHPRRLLGVTGTNGKTSTTELLAAMLTTAGLPAVACGNLGDPMSTAAAAAPEDAVLVAELSSFQLQFCQRLRPEVGVLLNLAPDHLDWHGDLAAYGDAKARLWQAQQPGDWAVANTADAATIRLRDERAPAGRAAFHGAGGVDAPGVGMVGGLLVASTPALDGPILAVADLPIDAPHHVANVAAAAAVAALAGVDADAIADAARRTRPGRHRMELVVEHAGVRYVDDSKATNVHAAAAALESADSIVWLAGGQTKGVDLRPLGAHLSAVREAVLFGEAAEELAAVCDQTGVTARLVGSIEEAVEAAAAAARPGDTVLLAPACASFDQFRDYRERGDRFAAAARQLADSEGEA